MSLKFCPGRAKQKLTEQTIDKSWPLESVDIVNKIGEDNLILFWKKNKKLLSSIPLERKIILNFIKSIF